MGHHTNSTRGIPIRTEHNRNLIIEQKQWSGDGDVVFRSILYYRISVQLQMHKFNRQVSQTVTIDKK